MQNNTKQMSSQMQVKYEVLWLLPVWLEEVQILNLKSDSIKHWQQTT